MIVELVIFFGALVILAKASKMVIDSSMIITEYTGISQLSIGFIVIALAVAMPDFMVVVTASFAQKSALAIGDALGSSIANICLVLGIATLIRRVDVERKHMLDSAELLLLISIVPALMLSKGFVGFYEGIILLMVFVFYCFFTIKTKFKVNIKDGITKRQWKGAFILFFAGLFATIVSAQFVVSSGSEIARVVGISEALIGMTLISFGTTLPELTLDFTAIRKGQFSLAIGDILGSTVINLTLILGLSLMISPTIIDSAMYTIPLAFIIIANSFLFYSLVKRGGIGQKEGMIFILMYVLFLMLIVTSKILLFA
ncbi:MAG: sodium:calcium antiporter [Candidatus Aenigmarchaeota archaeon]|nr:sodium:calcium antiporter [Candidatus Aenigmarchaeota archaeon]